MSIAPVVPQPLVALERANKIRLARAALKRRVATGELLAAQVVADPPECAQRMTIGALLCSQHRWAATRTRTCLAEVGMQETKTLESLTLRQRKALCGLLPGDVDVINDAVRVLEARERGERALRHAPCVRMNGRGPCLRPQGHARSCVVAVHAPALGCVYFRNGLTGDLLHSVDVALGGPCPSREQLVMLLAVAEAAG